jgi:hypothetical protein
VRIPVLLAAVLALLPACNRDTTVQDTRDIGKAYYALRDALLNGDDEAFFALHGSEARKYVLDAFPAIRADYLSGSAEAKAAFRRQYRVTDEEFLAGEPRALVVKMMPWKSGWRDMTDLFRTARVKDVSIEYVPLPGGGTERRGIVELEPPGGAEPGGAPYPTIVFIKEEGAWRRRAFFVERIPLPVDPPKKPGG